MFVLFGCAKGSDFTNNTGFVSTQKVQL